MLTQEQINRAPKFARDEIERLKRQLADKDNEIKRLSDALDAEGEREMIDPSLRDRVVLFAGGTRGLIFPQNSAVEFGLGQTYINVRLKDGHLYVYGSDRLRVAPNSSNTIDVWVER